MKTQDQARFFHQFAALLNSGMSIQHSLSLLEHEGQPAFRSYLQKVRASVAKGEDLATAIAHDRRFFDDWTLSLIKLAEYSGSLSETFRRLAHSTDAKQRRERLYGSITWSLLAGIWSLLILVVIIVQPNSNFLHHPEFWLRAIGLGLFLFGFTKIASAYFNRTLQQIGKSLPGFKKVVEARSLIDFAELSVPLSCGVPILTALELLRSRIGDPILAMSLNKAARQIRSGRTLSHSLQGKLPLQVLQMITVGEETGDLDGSLAKIGEYYESELERAVRQLEGILKPLSLIGFGALVAAIGIRSIGSMINSLPG